MVTKERKKMPVMAYGYSNPRVQFIFNKGELMIPIQICTALIMTAGGIAANKLFKD